MYVVTIYKALSTLVKFDIEHYHHVNCSHKSQLETEVLENNEIVVFGNF